MPTYLVRLRDHDEEAPKPGSNDLRRCLRQVVAPYESGDDEALEDALFDAKGLTS